MGSSENISFVLDGHKTNLMEYLHKQWVEESFCDLELCTLDGTLLVHCCVVAPFCPGIASTLRGQRESGEGKTEENKQQQANYRIDVQFKYDIVKCVMESIYRGVVSIDISVLEGLREASEWFGVKALTAVVKRFTERLAANDGSHILPQEISPDIPSSVGTSNKVDRRKAIGPRKLVKINDKASIESGVTPDHQTGDDVTAYNEDGQLNATAFNEPSKKSESPSDQMPQSYDPQSPMACDDEGLDSDIADHQSTGPDGSGPSGIAMTQVIDGDDKNNDDDTTFGRGRKRMRKCKPSTSALTAGDSDFYRDFYAIVGDVAPTGEIKAKRMYRKKNPNAKKNSDGMPIQPRKRGKYKKRRDDEPQCSKVSKAKKACKKNVTSKNANAALGIADLSQLSSRLMGNFKLTSEAAAFMMRLENAAKMDFSFVKKELVEDNSCYPGLVPDFALSSSDLDLFKKEICQEDTEPRLKCDKCKLIFTDPDEYQTHITDHPTFACETCSLEFFSMRLFVRHMRNHLKMQHLKCTLCEFSATESAQFSEHCLTVHQDTKPFRCTFEGCKYRTTKYRYLSQHFEIHENFSFRTNRCDRCGKCFPCAQHLRNHWKSCYKLQSYLCDVCGQAFNHMASMTKHRQSVHFGEKPYTCKVCQRSFTWFQNLRRHMRIHDNAYPYLCSICGQAFRYSNMLKLHMKKHGKDGNNTINTNAYTSKGNNSNANLNLHDVGRHGNKSTAKEYHNMTMNDNLFPHHHNELTADSMNVQDLTMDHKNSASTMAIPNPDRLVVMADQSGVFSSPPPAVAHSSDFSTVPSVGMAYFPSANSFPLPMYNSRAGPYLQPYMYAVEHP